MEKKFSVIVPAYNSANYLPRCLDSLLEQDLPSGDYEIIVVDDGSTDHTKEVLQEYARKAPNVRPFSTPNQGVGEARNYGLQQATGRYFTFVDADDWIERNSLPRLYDKMEQEQLDLLVLNFRYWNDKGELPRPLHYTDKCREGMSPLPGSDFMCLCLPPVVWGIVYRTDYWRKHKFRFLPIRHEDEELMPQVFYLAQRVNFLPFGFYHYYRNPGSFMMNYDPRSCLYMLKAMQSVEQFRLQYVKGEKMNGFFRDHIARRLLTALKRSIQWNAPAAVQLEMVREMKKCGLSPLSRNKSTLHKVLYHLLPTLYIKYYRTKVKRVIP